MRTMAGCALALALGGGCGPAAELSPTPTPLRAQASAYAVAPTCGPASVSSLRELLPDVEILGAMELDVSHLRRGALFPEAERLLVSQASDALAAMDACGVSLSKVEGVIVGFSDDDDIVMGVRAKGIGEPATLDCLAGKIEKSTGKAPWKRVTVGCETTLEMPDADGKGFAAGHDMVVLASKSLEAAVGRRVAGKDRSALDGRLAWARTEVDMTSTAWVATNLPKGAGVGLSPSMAGLGHVGMTFDATKGLGVKMGASFSSAAEAKAAAKELESQIVQLKVMLPLLGLPAEVADTFEVGARGRLLRLGMFLRMSDIEALRLAATGGQPPAPAPPPARPGL